jgi:hypothetical protein
VRACADTLAWIGAVRASQNDALLQKEADKMAQQTWDTYEQELAALFEQRGALNALRTALRNQLAERFQTVPPTLLKQIDRADLDHLQAALKQIMHIKSLDELRLGPEPFTAGWS